MTTTLLKLEMTLCALLATCSSAALARQLLPPPLPSWARGPDDRGDGEWEEFSRKQNTQNKAVVDKVDAEGKAFDFLLYGERQAGGGVGGSCVPACT